MALLLLAFAAYSRRKKKAQADPEYDYWSLDEHEEGRGMPNRSAAAALALTRPSNSPPPSRQHCGRVEVTELTLLELQNSREQIVEEVVIEFKLEDHVAELIIRRGEDGQSELFTAGKHSVNKGVELPVSIASTDKFLQVYVYERVRRDGVVHEKLLGNAAKDLAGITSSRNYIKPEITLSLRAPSGYTAGVITLKFPDEFSKSPTARDARRDDFAARDMHSSARPAAQLNSNMSLRSGYIDDYRERKSPAHRSDLSARRESLWDRSRGGSGEHLLRFESLRALAPVDRKP